MKARLVGFAMRLVCARILQPLAAVWNRNLDACPLAKRTGTQANTGVSSCYKRTAVDQYSARMLEFEQQAS